MKTERRDLCEGVSLTVLPTDKFKSNLLIVKLNVPLREETATHYSLLTNVLSRCCADYPTLKSFNIALEELYAADLDAYVSKSGEVQSVCFKLSCIENLYTYDGADVLEGAMRLMHCMIFKPLLENGAFSESVVEAEKKSLREEIEALKEDKARYAMNRCIKLMCEKEAYSVSAAGDVNRLADIDGKELKKCYDRLLATAPISIYFVGNSTADTVEDYCRRHLPFTPRSAAAYKTAVLPAASPVRHATERADVFQSKLCMAYRTPITFGDERYPAMLLACGILGSPCGKLFVNVREKLGLCYYCTPMQDSVKGVLLISAGIDGASREQAENAISAQIEELKNGIISETELASAKAECLAAYKEIYDSPSAVIGWYSTRLENGIVTTPEETAAAVSALSADDVARAAATLAPDTFYMLEGEECEVP